MRALAPWGAARFAGEHYGAIVLPKSAPLGNKVGWFGYANLGLSP